MHVQVHVHMCISGVAVAEIINYNSIYMGFGPLNYTFKCTASIYKTINTDSSTQLYALMVVAI